MLLMQVLVLHQEALEPCLASGDADGATWHASAVALLPVVMTATVYVPGLLLIADGSHEVPDPGPRETSINGKARR